MDGEEALARARALEPDLVLLDIMMPKLDGIAVLKRLKQDAALRFIPVILVTAKADTTRRGGGPRSRRRRLSHQAVRAGRAGGARALAAAHQGTARHGPASRPRSCKEQTERARRPGTARSNSGSPTQIAEIERIGRLQRFLAPQVARDDRLVGDADEALLASHRREVTVVFCDLRGFTAFTEIARARRGDGGAARVPREPRRADLPLRRHARALRRRRHHDRVQRSDPVRRPRRARRPAGARHARAGRRAVGSSGAARATSSASASVSPRATPRSARSASSSAANTPRSAASPISPRGCATRPARARSWSDSAPSAR